MDILLKMATDRTIPRPIFMILSKSDKRLSGEGAFAQQLFNPLQSSRRTFPNLWVIASEFFENEMICMKENSILFHLYRIPAFLSHLDKGYLLTVSD